MSKSMKYTRAENRYRRQDCHSSAGKLELPKTAVQRIMLGAKQKRLKKQFLERQGIA